MFKIGFLYCYFHQVRVHVFLFYDAFEPNHRKITKANEKFLYQDIIPLFIYFFIFLLLDVINSTDWLSLGIGLM